VAGIAAADALRGNDRESVAETPTTAAQTGPTRLPGPAPRPEAPAGWPPGTLDGSIVFADADNCRIRSIGLATGRERPLARFTGTCDLWAAPVGHRVAYGLGPSSLDGFVPFKLADLSLPREELGGYRALFGVVIWSPDGQRVAWCGRRRVGFDLEIGGPSRRLPACPAAYTQDGRIAYAIGKRLIVEDETVLQADGGVTYATFLADGGFVVVIDGRRLEKYSPEGALRFTLRLGSDIQGRTPIVSSDGCGVLFRPVESGLGEIRLFNLGCPSGPRESIFQGVDAAWDPDGHWVAVAQENGILFRQVVGGDFGAVWPASAIRLAWRPR
jgi:hypothetical protein